MNFLNTLVWWQWLLFALVPVAIVLLYFLKLKRLPLEVPSTYLWSRTIEDLHVNAIWQRLRRNLLLLLQLIIIALLAFSLWRPGRPGVELIGNRFLFLIDQSASMNATDVDPSRLEFAKQQAQRLVDQMQAGDVAMVVAFSDTPRIVQPFTGSRRLLRQRIEGIGPTFRATDLEQALRTASGLVNPKSTRLQDNQAVDEARPATMYLLSDGGFEAVPDFALGNLTPVYMPVGRIDTGNAAIVALSTDRNPEKPGQVQAFARVANDAPEEATVTLELFLDDTSLDVVELSIPPRQSGGWTFDLPELEQGTLRLTLSPPDALDADNVAYATINRPRQADVLLVTSGNVPLRTALETEAASQIAALSVLDPAQLSTEAYRQAAAGGAFDLVIYDRCRPEEMPQANTLFIGVAPPGETWRLEKQTGPPTIIDVDRAHPLTQLVDMDHVKIAEGHTVDGPPGTAALLDSVRGPVLAVAPREGFQDAVLGFTLVDEVDGQLVPNTTWVARRSFPVFMFNAVRYLGGAAGTGAGQSVSAGEPASIRLASAVTRVTVRGPDGGEHVLERQGQNPFIFTATDALGVYRVRPDGAAAPAREFAVNVCNERESRLATRTELEIGHEAVRGSTRLQPARQELWKWVALAALVVLLVEWYVYNRRINVAWPALR